MTEHCYNVLVFIFTANFENCPNFLFDVFFCVVSKRPNQFPSKFLFELITLLI